MPTFLDVLEKARASMFEDEEAKRVDSTSKGGEFVISLPDDMEDTPDPTEIPVIGKVGEYQTLIFWRDK
jgi:hypothetical protein